MESPAPLQLRDYEDGYLFRMRCGGCGYMWTYTPGSFLARPDMHANMYLEEVEACLRCARCKAAVVRITPLIQMSQHHFVGGLA